MRHTEKRHTRVENIQKTDGHRKYGRTDGTQKTRTHGIYIYIIIYYVQQTRNFPLP